MSEFTISETARPILTKFGSAMGSIALIPKIKFELDRFIISRDIQHFTPGQSPTSILSLITGSDAAGRRSIIQIDSPAVTLRSSQLATNHTAGLPLITH